MDDLEFRAAIKQILSEARQESFKQTALLLELGDEFGDTSFDSDDLGKIVPDIGQLAKTTLGSIANISNKVRTLISVFLRSIPALVVPYVKVKYEKIYADEARRQREIERMYPEIFTIARKGFSGDGQLFAFMLNPVVMTAISVGRLGSDVALDLIDGLSGSSPDVITKTRPLRRRVGARESLTLASSILLEDPLDKPGSGEKKSDVSKLLNDENFQQIVMNCEPTKKIIEAAKNVKNTTLNAVLSQAKEIVNATSFDELADLGLSMNQNLDRTREQIETENPDAIAQIVASTKKETIKAFVKHINDSIESFKQANIPEDSDLFKVYGKTNERLNEIMAEIEVPNATSKNKQTEPGSNGGIPRPDPVA